MKIAILTDFATVQDWFSLTRVVYDQAVLLHRAGHDVAVCVREDCDMTAAKLMPAHSALRCSGPAFEVARKIPAAPVREAAITSLADITAEDLEFVARVAARLRVLLGNVDAVITHDWLFTGSRLLYAEGLRLALDGVEHPPPVFNWLHSIPALARDWWVLRRFGRNHKLVYPNATDSVRVAEMYCTDRKHIEVVPHPVDLRTLCDFSPEAWDVIDACPGLVSADFTQVYPAAADRLHDKGLLHLIYVLKELKRAGKSVCLLVACGWTGNYPRESVEFYRRIASRNGLTEDELIFTSELRGQKYPHGLPKRCLREVMQFTNLFVYPSQAETFGLILHEAVLMGGVLPVLNRSLQVSREVGGNLGMYFDFGSADKQLNRGEKTCEYYARIADHVIATSQADDCFRARTRTRQTYNLDAIYHNCYAPMFTRAGLNVSENRPCEPSAEEVWFGAGRGE